MNVEDLMTTEVVTVEPDTSLKDVAATLVRRRISGMPVCDVDGRVLGVVSEGDILIRERGPARTDHVLGRLLRRKPDRAVKASARTAGEAMSSPAITIAPERPAAAAARTMVEHGVNRLPVVGNDTLVGIVTRADLVRAFTRDDAEIVAEIREDVLRRALWADPDTVRVEVEHGDVTLVGELETQSDVELLTKLVRRIPGVVDVRSEVGFRVDDLAQAAGRFAGFR